MPDRLRGRRQGKLFRRPVAERSAARGQRDRADMRGIVARPDTEDGVMFGIDGSSVAPWRATAAVMTSPADTSASLLARPMVPPCSIAAMVGARPAQPTMAAM